jgi:Asp-tRNA(Asn)/Glu-tRNA(Gln) amidotransferase A subunit family amidase
MHRSRLDEVLGDRVLLVPSASSAAPPIDATAEVLDAIRGATLRLTAVAGITGRPALSVPALQVPEPVGLCLVGPRGSDLALLDLGQVFTAG